MRKAECNSYHTLLCWGRRCCWSPSSCTPSGPHCSSLTSVHSGWQRQKSPRTHKVQSQQPPSSLCPTAKSFQKYTQPLTDQTFAPVTMRLSSASELHREMRRLADFTLKTDKVLATPWTCSHTVVFTLRFWLKLGLKSQNAENMKFCFMKDFCRQSREVKLLREKESQLPGSLALTR